MCLAQGPRRSDADEARTFNKLKAYLIFFTFFGLDKISVRISLVVHMYNTILHLRHNMYHGTLRQFLIIGYMPYSEDKST